MKLKLGLNTIFAGLIISSAASATTVTTGEFVLDFDESALLALPSGIKNSAWYDEANSKNKTATELLTADAQDSVPDTFTFKVFGSMITTPPAGLEGRKPVASTFEYTGDPATGTGKIGLAGVHQIRGAFDGALVSGDYDLNYDKDRVGNSANGSGWYLTNNISFSLIAYDLANVETTLIDDNNFSLSGDVMLSSGNAQMMMATEGTDVGDFTFTTVAKAKTDLTGSYSVESQQLTLPLVKVAETNYSAILKLVILDDDTYAFDLVSADVTTESPTAQTSSFSSTGVVTMPIIKLITSGNQVKAEMQLIEDSSPLRFTLTEVTDIDE